MRKQYLLGATTLLLFTTAAQSAPSSTELKIDGYLTPKSACAVSLTSGGLYDIGKIKNNLVQENTEVSLQQSTLLLNFTCEEKTNVSLTFTDNKNGTESNGNPLLNYGLGSVNGSGKLGRYTISLFDGKVDGKSTKFYRTLNNNGPVAGTSVHIEALKEGYHGWVDPDSLQAAKGKNYQAYFLVQPYLASRNTMNGPLTEDVTLDGSTTVNLFYAI